MWGNHNQKHLFLLQIKAISSLPRAGSSMPKTSRCSLPLSLSPSLSFSLFLSLFLSLALCPYICISISLSLSLSLTHTLSLSHIHILSLSLSHTHTHTLSLSLLFSESTHLTPRKLSLHSSRTRTTLLAHSVEFEGFVGSEIGGVMCPNLHLRPYSYS